MCRFRGKRKTTVLSPWFRARLRWKSKRKIVADEGSRRIVAERELAATKNEKSDSIIPLRKITDSTESGEANRREKRFVEYRLERNNFRRKFRSEIFFYFIFFFAIYCMRNAAISGVCGYKFFAIFLLSSEPSKRRVRRSGCSRAKQKRDYPVGMRLRFFRVHFTNVCIDRRMKCDFS